MISMIRMDLYRIVRSRSLYVILGFGIVCCLIVNVIFYVLSNSDILQSLKDGGIIVIGGSVDILDMNLSMSGTEYVHTSIFNNGLYSCMFGVFAALFVGSDFRSGCIKNLMAFRLHRRYYVVTKFISLFIVNVGLSGTFILSLLLFDRILPATAITSSLTDFVLYVIALQAVQAGFIAMILFALMLTRSESFGIFVSIVVIGGILSVLAEQLLSFFGKSIQAVSLVFQQNNIPLAFDPNGAMRIVCTALVWVILYLALGIFLIRKKDIA